MSECRKTTSAGYTKRITIQQQSTSKDSYGEQVNTWTDLCTVWANIVPLNGKQFFEANANNSEITHKVYIRYRTGIKAQMRVKYGARYFSIDAPININEQNKEILLMCKEINGGEA